MMIVPFSLWDSSVLCISLRKIVVRHIDSRIASSFELLDSHIRRIQLVAFALTVQAAWHISSTNEKRPRENLPACGSLNVWLSGGSLNGLSFQHEYLQLP
jgi:hypothetical protein